MLNILKATSFFTLVFCLCLVGSFSTSSWALVTLLPPSIIPEVLSETVPTAFSPSDLNEQDYQIEWKSQSIDGVRFRLARNSVQWVRVLEILAIPRARLIMDVTEIDGGDLKNADFIQGIETTSSRKGHAEIPVALISGESNLIHIRIKRRDKIIDGEVMLKFTPRAELRSLENRVYLDPSCSPFHVQVKLVQESSPANWMYLGCRVVRVKGEEFQTASLEIFTFWDHVGSSIKIAKVDTSASSGSIWPLRLRSDSGQLHLQSYQNEVILSYRIPKVLHDAGLGMGIGPYQYTFRGNGENTAVLAPIMTLYSSVFLTEGIRLVGFGIAAAEKHTYLDMGLYIRLENFRFIDRRLGVHLLVGAHAFGFQSQGQFFAGASAPQGFEMIYSDAFGKGKGLALGAFLYPSISNNSYYNVWLRWGSSTFAEINFIAWEATLNQIPFSSSTLGLTFGFPLTRFW